jgi:hypothetical protein
MRVRGKLIRVLLVAAAVGGAGAVIAKRRARSAPSQGAIPADIRAAVDEGVAAAGTNGVHRAAEPDWIPVAAPADSGAGEIDEPTAATTGATS